jgi:hypothetical protein
LARRLMVTHRRITVWALTRLQSTAAGANLLTCVHSCCHDSKFAPCYWFFAC